jgi:hypothetical protein
MTFRFMIVTGALTLMATGCTHMKEIEPVAIRTQRHSPVRLHAYDWPKTADNRPPENLKNILILPPFGLENPDVQRAFQDRLFSCAQRRFQTPLRLVSSNSAYAPYITGENLVRNDGSLNTSELAFIGALMNCTHVIFPVIREYRPYHPQRIDIQLVLINSGHAKICAELSTVLSASDADVANCFLEYGKANKVQSENKAGQIFNIKSPAAFQDFVADICVTVMADELSL